MNAWVNVVAALLLSMASLGDTLAEETGRWLAATNAPHCKIWDTGGEPEKSFVWRGKCDTQGRVAGEGMIEWRWNGHFNGFLDIRAGNGLALEDGKLVVRLPTTGINVSQDGCGVVKIEVPRTVAIAYDLVTNAILTNAGTAAKVKCPNSGVTVCIYYQNEVPSLKTMTWWNECAVYWQWDRSRPKMQFDSYRSKPRDAWKAMTERIRLEELRTAKEAKYAAQASQIEAEKAQAAAAREAFLKRYGATQIVRGSDLRANPFRFQGQTVAVLQHFSSMIGPGRAQMTDVVVDGVPSTLFKGGERLLLALKVTGKVAIKTPVGEVMVPHGKYVGMVVCHQLGCADYGMTR